MGYLFDFYVAQLELQAAIESAAKALKEMTEAVIKLDNRIIAEQAEKIANTYDPEDTDD